MSSTSTAARRISLTREGGVLRLAFPFDPALVERARMLAGAVFDPETKTWTCLVCAQSVDLLRRWWYEGLVETAVDDLVVEADLVEIAEAVLRRGTMKRPYRVVTAVRDEGLYARLRAIPGAVWEKEAKSMSYPPGAGAALAELVAKGTLSDPEKILSPAETMLVFDNRTGHFVVSGDERAKAAFDQHFPGHDVMATWHERGLDVAFGDTFTEEVYRGELARAQRGAGMNIEGFRGELWPYQAESVAVALERTGFGVFHEMGLGKDLAHGTGVLTPAGWVPVEDLRVGDLAIGVNGQSTIIIGVYPRGELDMFRVSFNDGSSVVTGGDHLWSVQSVQNGHRHPEEWLVKDTNELATCIVDGAGNLKWKIPVVAAVQFAVDEPLPIDPYLLGVLIGDGSLGQASMKVTSADQFILDEVTLRLPSTSLLTHSPSAKPYDYSIVKQTRSGPNYLRQTLDDLGLRARAWEKHIPEIYLRASIEDRWDLLRGLMDTDGCAGPDGTNEYVSVSKELADGVADLVQGLGGIVRRSTKQPKVKKGNARLAYRVNVKLNECPFLLPRKAAAWKKPTKYPPNRAIKSIEPAGRALGTCIAVDAPDQLYVTEHYIVTHNTVLTIAAGHELLFNRHDITRVVIVVPGTIRTQWAEEIHRFSNGHVVVIDGDAKKRAALYEEAKEAQWLVVHYDVLHRDLKALTPLVTGALLVADEAHRLKNPTAKRTKAMRTLASRAARRLALTGTPILNDPGEWYSVLAGFVAPGCFGSVIDFLNRYSYPNRWGGYEGARNLSELSDRSSTYYTRYTKREVATHLPPLRIKHMGLDVDPAYKTALVRAHREARDEIRDAAVNRAVASGRLGVLDGELRDEVETGAEMTAVSMLRLLCLSPRVVRASDSAAAQALFDAGLLPDADGPKVDELRSIAAEVYADGLRMVVFSSSKRMIYLLGERLGEDGVPYVTFTGDTSRADRDAAVAAFCTPGNDDNPGPTVFLSTDAGGEGLNLGAQCSMLVNMDIPWTPGVLAQRSARIHRLDGTAESYLVINMTLRGTIEEGIMRMVEHKSDLVDAIFGEEGGRTHTTGRRGRNIFEQALDEWHDDYNDH